jgi:predicted HicB family RNase H-like nuclease
VGYTDLDVAEDFLNKAGAIVTGQSYDTRITVPLEMSDDEQLRLMIMAHEQDITLNQLVEQILTEAIALRQSAN